MRKSYTVTLSAAVLALVLLTGCGELTDQANEVIERSVEEAVEIGDKAQSATVDWIEQVKADGINKELSTSQETGTASVLQLDNIVGNIEVKAGTRDKVIVSAKVWSMKDKTVFQDILDQAEVSVIVHGDTLEILTHPKGNTKQNLWDWAEDKYGVSDLTIDYIVEVPDLINSYEISNQVGEINLNDLKGTYQVSNQVGSVNIDGAHILGESSVKSEAGSLRLVINDMASDSSLNAMTEVGSIQTTLEQALKCNLDIKSELGKITGANRGENEINGGGPLLSLTSSVGSIDVDRAK